MKDEKQGSRRPRDRFIRLGRHHRPGLSAALLLATLLGVTGTGSGAPLPDPGRAAPDPTTHQLSDAGAVAILAGNFPHAAQLFKQAAAIDPEFTRAHLGLAIAALGSGDAREFHRTVRRAEALTRSTPELGYLMAVQSWRAGSLRSAEDAARGAAHADPTFLEARYLLGLIEAARGNLPHAAATLRETSRIDPTWAPVHLQLGAVLAASGDLDGAVAEIRVALSIAADLEPALPQRKLIFADRRLLPGTAHGAGQGLPLPVPAPEFLQGPRRSPLLAATDPAPVPEWFLDYLSAGFLEDQRAWSPAARLLERALRLNDREATRIPIGGRQLDYLPHRHLARVCLEMGDVREARAHLDIARNQAAAHPDTLGTLEIALGIASARTRLVLKSLPDRTTNESVAIRGLLLTRDPATSVDVGGHQALLRPATAEDLRGFSGEPSLPTTEAGVNQWYFEVPSYPLPSIGPHSIHISSGTAGSAGAEADVLILREGPVAAGNARPAGGTEPPAAGGESR